jgi:putative transposase
MGKRYDRAEIAAKLDQAEELAAQGKLHMDIAKHLGVSIMTYHRWRKARAGIVRSAPSLTEVNRNNVPNECDLVKRNGELQLENSRLRHLVAELLLEKMKVEERLPGNHARNFERKDQAFS